MQTKLIDVQVGSQTENPADHIRLIVPYPSVARHEGMKSELMTIGMLGDFGRRPGTVSFRFVSLVPHSSFLVKKESSRAYMTRSGKKSMSSLYSFLEVNRMYPLVD